MSTGWLTLFGMRKLAAVLCLLAATPALAGIAIDTSSLKTFTDCGSGGSSAQTLQGTYLLTVTDEDTWICITDSASTCATLGQRLPVGTVMEMEFGNFMSSRSVSCRSAGSTGDLNFAKKAN